MREEDAKGGEEAEQDNSRSDNNTSESHPQAVNDSLQSLEEADNIVQDALQLAENDELNEYRDVSRLVTRHVD